MDDNHHCLESSVKTMICKNCGKPGEYTGYIDMTFGEGDEQFIIQNVPVISCHSCGVDLLAAATLDRLEELWTFLRSNPGSGVNERGVKVTDYQQLCLEQAEQPLALTS